MIKETLIELALLFEIMLNQYAYETQNLIAIVNLAMQGKIHTSIFPTKRMIAELKEIKMNLPMGEALHLEIRSESLPDFYRIANISILHKDNYLIFNLEIPLIPNEIYHVYHPIPLPIPINNNSIVLIAPGIDHLALSSDSEKFFTLTHDQWESCLDLKTFKIYKGSQPIHRRDKSDLCEAVLLKNQQNLPNSCDIKYITINTSMWSRVPQTNSWLFYAQSEASTITCINPEQSFNIEISGTGRLTISSKCEIHNLGSIMLAIDNDKEINLDLVPSGSMNNLILTLSKILEDLIPQSITNTNLLKTFDSLARYAISINNSRMFWYV